MAGCSGPGTDRLSAGDLAPVERRPLRVVFVVESFWPEIGGLQRSTQRLAERLAQLGHTVQVVTQAVSGCEPPDRLHGLAIHRYQDGRVTFTGRAADDGLFAGADVICVFGVGSDPVGRWWLPVLDAPMAPGGARFLKPGTERDLSIVGVPGALVQRFDGVLCQTSRIAAEVRDLGVPDSACFPVRNGLPLERWRGRTPGRAHARAMLRVGDDAFCVLGLGRFIPRKRFGDLVRSFDRFACSAPRLPGGPPTLLLHGSDFGLEQGEEHELRRAVGRLDGRADVRFVSPDVEPSVTLAAADVLAVLSDREGAPNVFVEALAAGCPVVATNLAGHRVYVQHGREGVLVPVGDLDAQAGALHALAVRPVRRRAMALAAHAAARRFDIARTAEDYLRGFMAARQRRTGSPSPEPAGSTAQVEPWHLAVSSGAAQR